MRDRGMIKWTSMMLPEHKEVLKEALKENNHKEKPILDEQQLAENERMLQEAIENGLEVSIRYFKNHDFHVAEGKVSFLQLGEYLQINNAKIKLNEIIEVSL